MKFKDTLKARLREANQHRAAALSAASDASLHPACNAVAGMRPPPLTDCSGKPIRASRLTESGAEVLRLTARDKINDLLKELQQ